jgi:hypothetical protein
MKKKSLLSSSTSTADTAFPNSFSPLLKKKNRDKPVVILNVWLHWECPAIMNFMGIPTTGWNNNNLDEETKATYKVRFFFVFFFIASSLAFLSFSLSHFLSHTSSSQQSIDLFFFTAGNRRYHLGKGRQNPTLPHAANQLDDAPARPPVERDQQSPLGIVYLLGRSSQAAGQHRPRDSSEERDSGEEEERGVVR